MTAYLTRTIGAHVTCTIGDLKIFVSMRREPLGFRIFVFVHKCKTIGFRMTGRTQNRVVPVGLIDCRNMSYKYSPVISIVEEKEDFHFSCS